MLTLFCLLDGGAVKNAFHIDISEDQTISHLKKSIKEETMPVLRKVAAANLSVYRVSIPKGDEKALKEAENGIELGENHELDPLDTIRDVFPDPATGFIQIMVQRPHASSGK